TNCPLPPPVPTANCTNGQWYVAIWSPEDSGPVLQVTAATVVEGSIPISPLVVISQNAIHSGGEGVLRASDEIVFPADNVIRLCMTAQDLPYGNDYTRIPLAQAANVDFAA